MDVKFSYDEPRNIVFIEYVDLEMNTREEVDQLLLVVRDFLAPIGRKVYIVADMSGYLLNKDLTSYLATKFDIFAQLYVVLAFRYNVKTASTAENITGASMQSNLPVNIYTTKEAAIAAVEQHQRNLQ